MSVQLAILLTQYKIMLFLSFSYNGYAICPTAGFDPGTDQVHSEDSPSETEEWLLLVDRMDQSHQRAIVIKNKQSQRFLAVQNGCFTGLQSYNEDCKWFLE